MYFVTVAAKNLRRRRARSLLTVFGVAVGIQAMVALISIAWGFEKSFEYAYTARGTDLIIARAASRNVAPAPFDESLKAELLQMPRIQAVAGMLSEMLSVDDTPSLFVFGWESKSFLWNHLTLLEGRWPQDEQESAVVLGSLAVDITGKRVGDTVQIELSDFTVTGIYESNALIENGAVIMGLSQMQRMTEQEGQVNFFNVKLDAGAGPEDVEVLRQRIRKQFPGMTAFTTGELAKHTAAIKMAKAMGWATSVIALLVGAIAVLNTVLMSVFERTREIGVLLALGWHRRLILGLILCESVLLSIAGGMLGIVVGTVAVRLLQTTDALRGKIEGEISISLIAVVMLTALALGVLGGFYPAYRAARLQPAEALRHE
jgi:putative ABC transport system permease protein